MTWDRRSGMWLAVGVLAPIALAGPLLRAEEWVGVEVVPLVLVVPVVAMAVTGRRLPAFATACSAALVFDVAFTEPRGSVVIFNTDDVIVTVLLLAVGFLVTQLSLWGRRQATTADRAMSDVATLRATAELMAIGEPPDVVVENASFWLRELLGLRTCRFSWDLEPSSPAVVRTDGTVSIGPLRCATETQGLPLPDVDLPLHARGAPIARFVLIPTPNQPVMPDRLLTASALADMVGSWLQSGRELDPKPTP